MDFVIECYDRIDCLEEGIELLSIEQLMFELGFSTRS